MKLFVRSACKQRKERVKKHFESRGVNSYFDAIVWLEEYPKDHPMVKWLKQTLCKHMSVETISGYMKIIEFLKKTKNEQYVTLVDDDVVFPTNWKERFESVKLKPMNYLSRGVNFHIDPDAGYTISGNVGGCETMIFSRQFLDFFANNIDFRQADDIVMGAIALRFNGHLALTPICHQLSILDYKSSYNHNETKYEIDWLTFTETYKPSGLKLVDIENAFNDFMRKKKACDEDFLIRFDTPIDIWNIEYIYKHSELKNLKSEQTSESSST